MNQSRGQSHLFRLFGLAILLMLGLVACVNLPNDPLFGALDTDGGQAAVLRPAATNGDVRFAEVAAESGLDFQHGAFRWGLSGDPVAMMGGGLCWLDYDQDGWLDLFVVNNYAQAEAGQWQAGDGLPTSALYRNNQGVFTDVSRESGAAYPMRGNGCVAADLDLDGWPDIYVTTERVNLLLWNNGDGTFSEGAVAAAVDAYGWQTAAVVGDVNGDGLPDLFTAGYADMNNRIPEATTGFPNTHLGRRDLLFLNQGATDNGDRPTFVEVGELAGLESDNFEYGLGALLADFDGDGDLDLYVANDTNPNRLYQNYGWYGGADNDPQGLGFRFVEGAVAAGVADGNSGMGVATADYDQDGLLDLFVTNLGRQHHAAFRNLPGSFAFTDVTADLGLPDLGVGWTGWGVTWADFDLDSDLDLIVANGTVPVLDPPNDAQQLQLFANLTAQGEPGRFEEITQATGLHELGPFLARSSAVADYDNDGDLDIVLMQVGGPLALLRNEAVKGNWLIVDLEGFHPGAKVSALLPDDTTLFCEVHTGSSYLSSEDPRCHFGLGAADHVSELHIRWPSGQETLLESVPANQILVIEQPAD